MRILFIGNFAPPYEEENLHNLSLLRRLKKEGNDCCVINISEHPSRESNIIDIKNYPDYVWKLFRFARKRDIIHFFTKGYTRLGLLKLALAVLVGWLYRSKPVVTFHSELLSIIGLTRSPFGGQQTVHFSFSRAHRLIFTDRDTYDVASPYKRADNFSLIPSFFSLPENLDETESLLFKGLEGKKKIIFFSNVSFPSFVFKILDSLVSQEYNPDIGIIVSLTEKPSVKLQHGIEEIGGEWVENIVFIEPDNDRMVSEAYSRADVVLRGLSCDGKVFFPKFAVSLKQPVRTENYVLFPTGLLLLKEGEITEVCSEIIQKVLSEKTGTPSGFEEEDFLSRIKEIYGD
ncbi:glycosyltransferase family 1 protein [bacterium]|nr:MAG: glycosyltransferase family 1 protein [bacterium]